MHAVAVHGLHGMGAIDVQAVATAGSHDRHVQRALAAQSTQIVLKLQKINCALRLKHVMRSGMHEKASEPVQCYIKKLQQPRDNSAPHMQASVDVTAIERSDTPARLKALAKSPTMSLLMSRSERVQNTRKLIFVVCDSPIVSAYPPSSSTVFHTDSSSRSISSSSGSLRHFSVVLSLPYHPDFLIDF